MTGAVFLEGEKVDLRTIEEEDIEFLRDGVNHPEVRTFITVNRPINLRQDKEFFEEVILDESDVHLAIHNKDEIVGIISLEDEGEIRVGTIGIWLHPDFHGNGYGTEAAELITDYGFNELNYHKITTRAYENNKGSRRVWEKLGFTQEGTLSSHIYRNGSFEDPFVYGIIENEWK